MTANRLSTLFTSAAAAALLSLGACGDAATDDANTAERGPLGKADNVGTCVDACGGQSGGSCWCDEACGDNGDCCADYDQVCGGDGYAAMCLATGGFWEDGGAGCECEQDGASIGWVFSPLDGGCVDPESDAAVMPKLCEATNGLWENGACQCEQDGASIGWEFNPAKGCEPGSASVANNEDLCWNSGGAWEDGACECAQDGASLHYEFMPAAGGCVDPSSALGPVVELYAADVGAGWDEFVDPNMGIWVIHRPGVADVPSKFNDLEEVSNALAYATTTAYGLTCEVKQEEAPTYDCDTEFDKEGCFATPTDSFDGVSKLMIQLNDYGFADYSADEIGAAQIFEANVDTQVVSTDNGMTLYFGVVDGEWRLLVIDVAQFDCSA